MKSLVFLAVMIGCGYAIGLMVPDGTDMSDPILLNQYVNITIEDGIAAVSSSQEFINRGDMDYNGTYVFPVPDGGVSGYTLTVDGRRYDAESRDSAEADEEFKVMITERKDASLLKLLDRDTLSAGIYIPKGKSVRISILYEQAVLKTSGLYSFVYPLHADRYSLEPVDPINISVNIKDTEDLGVIYSPTLEVDIVRISKKEATVGYHEERAIPNKDFVLFYGDLESDNDMKVAAHKNGEEGYFMLFIHPSISGNCTIPKDIVFVIDRSGSMSGEKMEQAKTALKDMLQGLRQDDRFNIISFSHDVDKFSEELEGVSSVKSAERYVDSLYAGGSTDLYTPQIDAVDMLGESDGRTKIVIFLTDGVDTTGHSTEEIIDTLKERDGDWRIYPFGIGRDLDFDLISREANEFGDGIPVYVESDSDLEGSLTGFYDRISVPAVRDAQLDISQFAYEVYPNELDNLYAENTRIITGKYRTAGNYTVRLKGRIGEKDELWDYSLELPGESDNPFVERSWAVRKIGYLMDQINLEGETDALKGEVEYLGNRYALATPYTSLLVKAQEQFETAKKKGLVSDAISSGGYDIRFDDLEAHGEDSYAILSIWDTDGTPIDRLVVRQNSTELWVSPEGKEYDITVEQVAPGYTFGAKWASVIWMDYENLDETMAILNQGEGLKGSQYTAASSFESGDAEAEFSMHGTRRAGDKTFVLIGDAWLDTSCSGNENATEIEFGSREYFDLLSEKGMSEYLSVGENLLLCGPMTYEIHEKGEDINYSITIQNASTPGMATGTSGKTIFQLGDDPPDWEIGEDRDVEEEMQVHLIMENKGLFDIILDFFKAFFNLN